MGSWVLDEVSPRIYNFSAASPESRQVNCRLREYQEGFWCRARNRGVIRSYGNPGKCPYFFLSQFAMRNHNGYSDLTFFRPWHQASRVKAEQLEFHSLHSANSMQVHHLRIKLRGFHD